MKRFIIQILLILLLQVICCVGFAQINLSPCGGGDPKPFELPPPRLDPEPSTIKTIISFWSFDPNEIVGLEGYNAPESEDTSRWVSATQSLAYTIYFENDAELAMAAASKVTITVPLHEKLNYATFGVGSFGFGNYIFAVEGSPSSYQTRIDLRDSMGIYLDVVAGLDIVHNEAFWIFQSIDPATGLPPTDIHLGFLPINDSLHSGEGFVTCTIKPKAGECVTGDTVSATASIVFDVNEAIPTNTWVNTIDAFAPTSTLTITPNAAGDMLTATFAGEDDEGGCGIKQYKLYYSVNGSAYQLYDVYPVGDTAQIPVETGMEYEFFTLAEDNVGNCELMKTQPEYNIGTNFVTLAVNAFPQEAGTVTGGDTYAVNDTAQLSATAGEGYHFVNWMAQGVPVSTENPYSVVVSQNQTYTAYFERNAYTLQTLAAVGSSITVVDLNGNEVPSGSTVLHFDQLIISTDTADCYAMESVLLNGAAYVPGDTLTVTGDIALSTTTESLLTQTDTTATACDSFVWYGEKLTETGDYTKTFTSTVGCDSVVTLHLTINFAQFAQFADTACDAYTWNGTTYTQSGDYTQTFTATDGCDSVVTLHLTINFAQFAQFADIACDSYTWNGTTYTQSGDYTQTFTAADGCDSMVTLHLTVNHGTYTETTVDTCGTQYYWALADTTVNQSGTYYHYSSIANDCTDTTVLILLLYQPVTTEISAQICEGEVYNQNGFIVSTAGDHQLNLQTVHGCDSTVILHLAVGSETVTYLSASICEGDNYYENGFAIMAPAVGTQVYSDTIARPGTCDSVVTLTLTVHAVTSGDTTAVVSNSFDWYGQHLTTTGDYTHTFTNAAGCDSVVTLHLIVNSSTTGDTTAIACDSFDWYEYTNLTSSGDYMHTFTNTAGSDSVVTLHLTVNHSVFEDMSVTTCGNYGWNDSIYTETGVYNQTFTAANGCDSVVTLSLTIQESPMMHAITGEPEVCINQYATYHYDISDPNYQYTWLKDDVLWAENVPVMTLHELSESSVQIRMSVMNQDGCHADTSLLVQVVNRIAPDTTEIRRKVNTNILFCQPVYSDYGQVHYRWGYTDLSTSTEVVMPGDRNYCLYDFGIDTLSYRYWVETYLGEAVGTGCENRSYYAYGYITTSTPDYEGNIVEAYLSNNRIVLYVSPLSPNDITASLYDVNGKLLVSKGYGITDQVSDMIPVSIAPGVYFLRVSIGGQMYSVKLLKI